MEEETTDPDSPPMRIQAELVTGECASTLVSVLVNVGSNTAIHQPIIIHIIPCLMLKPLLSNGCTTIARNLSRDINNVDTLEASTDIMNRLPASIQTTDCFQNTAR